MFTGIITDIGEIKAIAIRKNGLRFEVATAYDTATMAIGCSVAHNGVCLTVVSKQLHLYAVDISDETLRCTALADWQVGDKVNLERALCMGDELGGHIVSGHVDGVCTVMLADYVGDNLQVTIKVNTELKRFIATKCSVTLNGVSLTVNVVNDDEFSVNLIAHTLQETTLAALKKGDAVNIEIDMLARYVERIQTA